MTFCPISAMKPSTMLAPNFRISVTPFRFCCASSSFSCNKIWCDTAISQEYEIYGKDRELLSYCFIQGQNIHLWVHSSYICHQTASSLTRQMLVLSNVNLFRQCTQLLSDEASVLLSDETIVREVAFLVRLHSTQTNVNVVLQINYISNKCKCSQTNISQTHLEQM